MTRGWKSLWPKLLLLVATLVVGLGIAEVAVRATGEFDKAGNFVFRNRVIHPHHLPVESVTKAVRRLAESDDSLIIYDQNLGWAPRPGATGRDGLYRFNSQGLRSPVNAFAATPDTGVLRIALFGDSFTHGDDVPYEDSFGAILEAGLRAAGVRCEVLNFGVGGYGIDQAMLRYEVQGRGFTPDLVVLGFQPENLKRNLNLLRPLYDPRTHLPFAKPRFVFEGNGISLINVPVLPPGEVAATLNDLDNWALLPHEYFYDPADYRGHWWQHSKLAATLVDLRRHEADPWALKRLLYRPGSEAQRLGWAIVGVFARKVEVDGAGFMVVHLPTVGEMDIRRRLGRWPYQAFLSNLGEAHDLADPGDRLLAAIEESNVRAVIDGHYTARGNRIVAESLQQLILQKTARSK